MYLTIFLIALGVLLFFLISYLQLKRKRVRDFNPAWSEILNREVTFYRNLSADDRKRFELRILKFLNEVRIEGIDTEITEKDKMLISASAIIPVFGFPEWHYSNLTAVILYPDRFNKDYEFDDHGEGRIIMGMVGSGRMQGQMILSRKALYSGFSPSAGVQNTGIHEFVHLIDKMDGETDGVPKLLMDHVYSIPWLKLIHKEMRDIISRKSDIRPYGSTSEAEFLAVASEYFFTNPQKMEKKHPELYEALAESFHSQPQAKGL